MTTQGSVNKTTLDDLWNSAQIRDRRFQLSEIAHLPISAQRYLNHAIAPNTPLASAVRLTMHGQIKLQRWLPFTAEEVITWNHGMIWKATVRMNGLPIFGSDRLVNHYASMQWKLLGLFPVMAASGEDIWRSGLGRVQAEAVWLPSVLCHNDVAWMETDTHRPTVQVPFQDEASDLNLTIDDSGQLRSLQLQRWGNPEGNEFHTATFGGIVESEATFNGYTIPTSLRIGWYFGSDRFEPEGEFFRVTIDTATYR